MKSVNADYRENNYDLLRIISCIGVIVIHTTSRYPGRANMRVGGGTDGLDFVSGLVRYAVPCFLMISGRFLLANKRNCDYGYFFNKVFAKSLIPVFVISIVGVCYSELNCLLLHASSYITPIVNWALGRPFYHLWYVYTLLGIYLLIPSIVNFKNSMTRKQYNIIGLLWFVASIVSCLFCDFQLAWGVHTVACFASWMVLGNIISDSDINIRPITCFGIGMLFLLLTG
ncbi:MAG: acyltransferase family protein, partial [Lachnospiraceae bacterium]|nr:acyltransferase family protein [Lachnospiraceae bacterium]